MYIRGSRLGVTTAVPNGTERGRSAPIDQVDQHAVAAGKRRHPMCRIVGREWEAGNRLLLGTYPHPKYGLALAGESYSSEET